MLEFRAGVQIQCWLHNYSTPKCSLKAPSIELDSASFYTIFLNLKGLFFIIFRVYFIF
jgi:hypothetical protein